jgi:Spy/CpxP family protein refolding chaperone
MLKKIIPLAAIAVLVISGFMLAGCGPRRFFCATPEDRAAMIVKKITCDLKLSKEQLEKVNRIKDEILAKTKNIRDERESVHNEMMALVKSDKLDRNMVNRFITAREDKIRALKPFFVDKIVELHALLTPEQRIKVAEKMEKIHNWCGKK